jgi:hypothetical protein
VSISVGGSKPELGQAIDEITTESAGRGSYRKVVTKEGKIKFYYHETKGNSGPESIIYAAEVLLRALRRAQRMAKRKSAGTSA